MLDDSQKIEGEDVGGGAPRADDSTWWMGTGTAGDRDGAQLLGTGTTHGS